MPEHPGQNRQLSEAGGSIVCLKAWSNVSNWPTYAFPLGLYRITAEDTH
jgi:hypothetical protein